MKGFLFFMILLVGLPAGAQSPASLEQWPGKWNRRPVNNIFSAMEGKNNLKGTAVKRIQAALTKQLHGFNGVVALHPPRGFEVDVNTSVEKYNPQLGDKRYSVVLWLNFRHYLKDRSGKVARADEGSASIRLHSNPAGFMTGGAGFFGHLDMIPDIPHFFQKIPATDSTADYIEYSFKNYPFNRGGTYGDFAIRIVRRNNIPLFVPFTRKEYIQYLAAMQKKRVADDRNDIEDRKKNIAKEEKDLNDKTMAAEYKKMIPELVQINKERIRQTLKSLEEAEKKLVLIESVLVTGPAAELQATAYIDTKTGKYAQSVLQYLVPYGRKEGWPLSKVNPDYYNNRLAPDKVQSVMVTYWYHKQFCPGWLQKRTREIFDQIDYQQLKKSMQ